jgi:hypothetical protein
MLVLAIHVKSTACAVVVTSLGRGISSGSHMTHRPGRRVLAEIEECLSISM